MKYCLYRFSASWCFALRLTNSLHISVYVDKIHINNSNNSNNFHTGTHLRSNETVVYLLVALSRQIFTIYFIHTIRGSTIHTHLKILITLAGLVQVTESSDTVRASCSADVSCGEFESESVTESADLAVESQPELIEQKIAAILSNWNIYFIFQQNE